MENLDYLKANKIRKELSKAIDANISIAKIIYLLQTLIMVEHSFWLKYLNNKTGRQSFSFFNELSKEECFVSIADRDLFIKDLSSFFQKEYADIRNKEVDLKLQLFDIEDKNLKIKYLKKKQYEIELKFDIGKCVFCKTEYVLIYETVKNNTHVAFRLTESFILNEINIKGEGENLFYSILIDVNAYRIIEHELGMLEKLTPSVSQPEPKEPFARHWALFFAYWYHSNKDDLTPITTAISEFYEIFKPNFKVESIRAKFNSYGYATDTQRKKHKEDIKFVIEYFLNNDLKAQKTAKNDLF